MSYTMILLPSFLNASLSRSALVARDSLTLTTMGEPAPPVSGSGVLSQAKAARRAAAISICLLTFSIVFFIWIPDRVGNDDYSLLFRLLFSVVPIAYACSVGQAGVGEGEGVGVLLAALPVGLEGSYRHRVGDPAAGADLYLE